MGIAVMMLLIEVHVQVGPRAKKVVNRLVGKMSAVDIERFELRHLSQLVEARIGNRDVDQMQPLECGQTRDRLDTRICNVWTAHAKLYQHGEPIELSQADVGNGRLRDVENYESFKVR